jgi:hypothetical protein
VKANSLSRKLVFIVLSSVLVSGCASNSEETVGATSSLGWMDEFIEVQGDLDAENVYTFVCESITKKPERVTTTCADFGEEVLDIKWTAWLANGAKGTGIHSVNDCLPDCADGNRVTTPVYLWLNGTTTDNKNYYLHNLFIVPRAAYDGETSNSGKREPLFTTEFTLENRSLFGQEWNLADFWKSNPKFRANLPE